MKLILILLSLLFSSYALSDCVILLHGLLRSHHSMEPIEKALKKEHFNVVNISYPSRKGTIETLANNAIGSALESCSSGEKVNFVTHSLGGILVRQYLSQQKIANLSRVVMLGPPNKGSEIVDKLAGFPGFHFINGDAGLQVGTDKQSLPLTLGKANFDVGIIAGTKSINWILSSLIPDIDDGKVSVKSTKLEGMNDHIEMPVTHPFMMRNKAVISQIIYYLKVGQFERGPEA